MAYNWQDGIGPKNKRPARINLAWNGIDSNHVGTDEWVELNKAIGSENVLCVNLGLGSIEDARYWENSSDYYAYMGQSAMDFEEKIRITAAEIDAVRTMKGFNKPISISFDEWGTLGRDFLSVLPVAQSLNSFIRHADAVKMANFTMLTSLLSSDKQKGTFKTPLFHIFKLFSNNCRGNSVDTYVESDTFNTV
jgi:alpha-N-arabinofuranosidase